MSCARSSGTVKAATSMRRPQMHIRHFRFGICFLALFAQVLVLPSATGQQTFRSDEWITECEAAPGKGAPDCSITVPFWQARAGRGGSFALVVMLQTGSIGIVGQPFPEKAVLRVDKTRPSSADRCDTVSSPAPKPRRRRPTKGCVAHIDRCVYGQRNVQLQFDAEGVPGGNGENPCMGVSLLPGLAGFVPLASVSSRKIGQRTRDHFLTRYLTPG